MTFTLLSTATTLLLLQYLCMHVCMYVCMYGVKRVYKAQSYWLCPRACRWGLGAFRLFCYLTGSYLYLSISFSHPTFPIIIIIYYHQFFVQFLTNYLTQYLEEKYPHHHPFLPQDLHKKAINFQVSTASHTAYKLNYTHLIF